MAQDKDKNTNRGRPRVFNSAEELQEAVDEYFQSGCTKKETVVGKGDSARIIEFPVPTMSELAFYLGFSSRSSLYEYENHEEFSDTIKKARLRVEIHYEQLLQLGGGSGPIFALKNFGWTDKQEIDLSSYDFEVGHDTEEEDE